MLHKYLFLLSIFLTLAGCSSLPSWNIWPPFAKPKAELPAAWPASLVGQAQPLTIGERW